jgi:hypothetical protein
MPFKVWSGGRACGHYCFDVIIPVSYVTEKGIQEEEVDGSRVALLYSKAAMLRLAEVQSVQKMLALSSCSS